MVNLNLNNSVRSHKWRTVMRSINGYRYGVEKHRPLSGTKMVIVNVHWEKESMIVDFLKNC